MRNFIGKKKNQNFVCDRLENIVRKRSNAGCQHFLLFPQCFQKVSCTEYLEVVIV